MSESVPKRPRKPPPPRIFGNHWAGVITRRNAAKVIDFFRDCTLDQFGGKGAPKRFALVMNLVPIEPEKRS